MQIDARKRIADRISAIMNPFLVSVIIIMLLSFESATSLLDRLRWSLILIAISVLPVFLFVAYLVHRNRLEGFFAGIRSQRTKIYLLAGGCGVVGCIVLFYFGAPSLLMAGFGSGLAATLLFMCINLWWKISLHSAFVTGSITVLVIMYGLVGVTGVVLLPLIYWARTESNHHTVAQVVIGALLAVIVVVVVFYLFGLVQV